MRDICFMYLSLFGDVLVPLACLCPLAYICYGLWLTLAMRIFSLLIFDVFFYDFTYEASSTVSVDMFVFPFFLFLTHTHTGSLSFSLPIFHHFHWNKFHYLLSWSNCYEWVFLWFSNSKNKCVLLEYFSIFFPILDIMPIWHNGYNEGKRKNGRNNEHLTLLLKFLMLWSNIYGSFFFSDNKNHP